MALDHRSLTSATAGWRARRADHHDSARAAGERALTRLIEGARLELVPMGSLPRAIGELAPGADVSVTCSPARSIEATLDVCAELADLGHRPVPHLSARMVASAGHLEAIHGRLGELGLREVFLVGGDADPPGCFVDALELLDALLELDGAPGARHVDHVGVTAYPDTHPTIPGERLHEALHRKQATILASGRTAHASTQMCFDPVRIEAWLRDERAAGLRLPVHLGIAGVIDTAKLMSTGVRLGVGPSLRYLRKNRRALGALLTQRSYEPGDLLRPLAPMLDELGVGGLHVFTFNQVAATRAWRERALARA